MKKLDRIDAADDTLDIIIALVRWIVRLLRGPRHEQTPPAPSQGEDTPQRQP